MAQRKKNRPEPWRHLRYSEGKGREGERRGRAFHSQRLCRCRSFQNPCLPQPLMAPKAQVCMPSASSPQTPSLLAWPGSTLDSETWGPSRGAPPHPWLEQQEGLRGPSTGSMGGATPVYPPTPHHLSRWPEVPGGKRSSPGPVRL